MANHYTNTSSFLAVPESRLGEARKIIEQAVEVFLLAIVLLAVYRNGIHFLNFVIGIGAFVALIYPGAVAYRKRRDKQG